MSDLGPALDRLLDGLRRAGSPAADLLRSGLGAEQIGELAARMPAGLPDEVAALHGWRDGLQSEGAPEQELFAGGFWLSLEQALELRDERLDVIGTAAAQTGLDPELLWRASWLPAFADFAGNVHVVACESREASPVWFVAGGDPDDRRLAFDSVSALVETVATCWQDGIFDVRPGGVQADEPRFDEVWRRYNPAAAAVSQIAGTQHERDLASPDPSVRAAAARMSGGGSEPAPVHALRRALDDPDADVRSEAAAALGRVKDAGSAERLAAALGDASDLMRTRAAWALGCLRYKPAVPALAAALEDPALPVRIEAARALMSLRSAEAIPALVAATAASDPVPDVRRLAVAALAKIRHPDARAAIEPLADDDDPVIRNVVQAAAGKRR